MTPLERETLQRAQLVDVASAQARKRAWNRHLLHFGTFVLLGAIPTGIVAAVLSEDHHTALAVILMTTNIAAMKMAKDNGYNLAKLPRP